MIVIEYEFDVEIENEIENVILVVTLIGIEMVNLALLV